MDVQSGQLTGVSDRTRPQRRCRRHRRAAGGQAWAGTARGWFSRRVVILEGLVPGHRPLLVRAQLGRPKCGGSPASRGFAGPGVTGLSAARLRAGTTVDAFSAVPAVVSLGAQRVPVKRGALTARGPRWAAPDQPILPLARSRPAGGARMGSTAGRLHRTPRCGLGRGLRADRVTRRSRSVSPYQSRSRHLASARA